MAKERRNHEDVYAIGPTYSRVVRAGNTVYVSGVTAWRSDAQGGSPMDQLDVILDRITRIVAAEGGTPADIVVLTTYVTKIADFWPIGGEQRRIYEKYFKGEYPTNTFVEVSALAAQGMDVEITATAVLD